MIDDKAKFQRLWLINLIYGPGREDAPQDDQLYRDAIEAALHIRRWLTEATDLERRLAIASHLMALWTLLTQDPAGGAFGELFKELPKPQNGEAMPRQLIFRLQIPLVSLPPQLRSFGHSLALLPADLHAALLDGLNALERGEVTPLLERVATGRHKKPHTWDEVRMRALEHVHFLAGQGLKKGEAQTRVARAIGVNARTLREWEERDLPQIYVNLAEVLGQAKRAGALRVRLDEDPDLGKRPGQVFDAEELHIIEQMKKEPLAAFAKRFQDGGFAKRSWNPER